MTQVLESEGSSAVKRNLILIESWKVRDFKFTTVLTAILRFLLRCMLVCLVSNCATQSWLVSFNFVPSGAPIVNLNVGNGKNLGKIVRVHVDCSSLMLNHES